MKKFLGIVPARASSTGIVNKNLQLLEGRSLVGIAIEEALSSNMLDDLVVSSDSEKILTIGKELGAKVQARPISLAQKNTLMSETLLYVLETFQKETSKFFDYFVILMPTAPLRVAKDIDDGISLMLEKKAASLVAVQTEPSETYKNYYLHSSGFLKGLRDDKAPFTNRQECPQVLKSNGFLFIFPVKKFLQEKTFPLIDTIPFFIDRKRTLDIDTPDDLQQARKFFRNK